MIFKNAAGEWVEKTQKWKYRPTTQDKETGK